MPRLWAKTTTFETVSLGDELPILVKWETEQSIQRFGDVQSPTASSDESAESGEKSPAQTDSVWSMAFAEYVAELLEKGFQQPNLVSNLVSDFDSKEGSQLKLEILLPVNLGDTLALSGSVVDKRVEQELRLVECRVIIENQSGETVASANVLVSI
ncbi:MAG: hypothetical protein BZY81_01830 [SAR202 cluster bacterium Io17-Chloro-G4]|nr:MAG: hypothetical protein BZY81_01830 [SAR202 cluster bacterium Io17-Chloro-G4]